MLFRFAVYVRQLSTSQTIEVEAETEKEARKQILLIKLLLTED